MELLFFEITCFNLAIIIHSKVCRESCKEKSPCNTEYVVVLMDTIIDYAKVTIFFYSAFEHNCSGLVNGKPTIAKLDIEACNSSIFINQVLAAITFNLLHQLCYLRLKGWINQFTEMVAICLSNRKAHLPHNVHIRWYHLWVDFRVKLVLTHVESLCLFILRRLLRSFNH